MSSREDFINNNNLERENFIRFFARKIKKENFSDNLKSQHSQFINAQFEMSNSFYSNLASKKGGLNKIRKLTGLSENQVKRFFG